MKLYYKQNFFGKKGGNKLVKKKVPKVSSWEK